MNSGFRRGPLPAARGRFTAHFDFGSALGGTVHIDRIDRFGDMNRESSGRLKYIARIVQVGLVECTAHTALFEGVGHRVHIEWFGQLGCIVGTEVEGFAPLDMVERWLQVQIGTGLDMAAKPPEVDTAVGTVVDFARDSLRTLAR
jgi:hypothetical protein